MLPEPFDVVAHLARVFDELRVAYVVGGSLASSMYGIPRATQDADLVAALSREHVEPFCGAVAGDFYIDADMMRAALDRHGSFNVIYLATMFKVDIFIAKDDEWSRGELARARREPIGDAAESTSIAFASPEDVLVHKLVWYRRGDHVSDRQWGDIMGLVQIQRGALDLEYVETWAKHFGVDDLWRKALAER